MERDELIYKWLNYELNAEEFEAFKQLEEYQQLIKMNEGINSFKSPDYEVSEALQSVRKRLEVKKEKRQKKWLLMAISIAAILVLFTGFLYYTRDLETTITTLASQKESVVLPDGSKVQLNAKSLLSFNTRNWNDNRVVQLKGEAYFKVAKGSKFDVQTPEGKVTVLGTEFNVHQRDGLFKVICYEGLVNVTYSDYHINLPPGNSFLIRDGKLIATEKENLTAPSWIDNYSRFKSVPYKEVLAEFERQFNVEIVLNSVDDSQRFTGSFNHNTMESALKAITLPLHLSYSKTNRTITLKREKQSP